jgi:hypothetical protein
MDEYGTYSLLENSNLIACKLKMLFYLEHHHVKFCEDGKDTFTKHNCVTIQKQPNNRLQVNLGFLKLNHNYSITGNCGLLS